MTLGGSSENDAALAGDKVADTIEKLLQVYVEERMEAERFLDTYRRIGIEPFKEKV